MNEESATTVENEMDNAFQNYFVRGTPENPNKTRRHSLNVL